MNDLVALSKTAVAKKPYDPIPKKCMYIGCPMKPSWKDDDGYKCSFHENGDYHAEVSQAIRDNMSLIKAYNSMVNWSVVDWVDNNGWLRSNNHLAINEGEHNSAYVLRFWNWLCDKIQDESVIIINNIKGYKS